MVPITISAITSTEGTNTGTRMVETFDDLAVVVFSEVIVKLLYLCSIFGANFSQLKTYLPLTAGKAALHLIVGTHL